MAIFEFRNCNFHLVIYSKKKNVGSESKGLEKSQPEEMIKSEVLNQIVEFSMFLIFRLSKSESGFPAPENANLIERNIGNIQSSKIWSNSNNVKHFWFNHLLRLNQNLTRQCSSIFYTLSGNYKCGIRGR